MLSFSSYNFHITYCLYGGLNYEINMFKLYQKCPEVCAYFLVIQTSPCLRLGTPTIASTVKFFTCFAGERCRLLENLFQQGLVLPTFL